MSEPLPPFNSVEGGASTQSRGQNKAVALHYDRDMDAAPRITATGRGYVADQIVALAFAHGVRVREDADLVEVLATLEVDSVIPLEAFTAVAEILSYVYRANALAKKSNETE
jgi:flagellar biosynthesis protein